MLTNTKKHNFHQWVFNFCASSPLGFNEVQGQMLKLC